MDAFRVILTALLSVAALFVITKIMGHKQVAQLDFFDYVSGITIGSIGAELATELESPEKPLVALCVYGLVSLVLNFLAHKIPKTRKYINGTPTILMSGGKIYRRNLKRAKLDLSEFMLLCRDKGFFDLDEIEVAVFEHNGKLSVLPRSESRPLSPKDIKIETSPARLGAEVIMDGRIIGDNLSRSGKNERWLADRLKAQGYNDPKDIFLGIYHPEEESLSLYPNE